MQWFADDLCLGVEGEGVVVFVGRAADGGAGPVFGVAALGWVVGLRGAQEGG